MLKQNVSGSQLDRRLRYTVYRSVRHCGIIAFADGCGCRQTLSDGMIERRVHASRYATSIAEWPSPSTSVLSAVRATVCGRKPNGDLPAAGGCRIEYFPTSLSRPVCTDNLYRAYLKRRLFVPLSTRSIDCSSLYSHTLRLGLV
jgi:hypothetical protein